ncbi:MAG: metallophosphoesterase, partial [Chloroflexota bacterium]
VDTRTATHALIDQLNALPHIPDFILHTGDVAYDPYPENYDEISEVFEAFPAKLMYVPGNHDHSATMQTTLMGREEAEVPLFYETAMNGVRLIFLDSNGAAPPPMGDVSAEQVAWLVERLATDDPRPVLVFVHHPLVKTHTSAWYDEFMITVNGDAVHEVLRTAGDRLRGVFFGHVHQHITFYRDGVMYNAVKSSWTQFHTHPDQPNETRNALEADPGYALVTVTTEGTIVQHFTYRMGDQ